MASADSVRYHGSSAWERHFLLFQLTCAARGALTRDFMRQVLWLLCEPCLVDSHDLIILKGNIEFLCLSDTLNESGAQDGRVVECEC